MPACEQKWGLIFHFAKKEDIKICSTLTSVVSFCDLSNGVDIKIYCSFWYATHMWGVMLGHCPPQKWSSGECEAINSQQNETSNLSGGIWLANGER